MKSPLAITKVAASKGTVMRFPPFRFLAFAALVALVAHRSVPAVAGEVRYGLPGKLKDEKLFVDGAAWLEKRLADAECRRSLGDAYAAYRKAPSDKTFLPLEPLLQKCGRCAVRDVERKVERLPGKPPARWYVSDGSCWVGDSKGLEGSLRKIVDDLLVVSRYPHKNGGYRAILEFFKTDAAGVKAPATDKPESESPFFAFIAVRFPAIATPTVATYFVKNTFERKDNDLWLSFRSEPRPEKLVVEELGVEFPVVQVQGQWFVSKDGYLRYSTAADFGIPMPSIADGPARRTLLETLVETLARGDLEP